MHSPLEIARNYIEVGIHKVNLSIFKTILLGFFAGMFIGFAGIASTTASSTIGIASVAKLVGAAVFPAGMAMVLVAGSELFTGNNLIILAVLEKKVTVWKMLKNWLFVYIGNFLGAAFVAVLVVVGRTPDLFGEQLAQAIVNAAASRTNLSVGEAFVRGILCNILVCIAVWMSFAAKRVSGKLLTSYWPVMLFVLCGFEHSIADMYFGDMRSSDSAGLRHCSREPDLVQFPRKSPAAYYPWQHRWWCWDRRMWLLAGIPPQNPVLCRYYSCRAGRD